MAIGAGDGERAVLASLKSYTERKAHGSTSAVEPANASLRGQAPLSLALCMDRVITVEGVHDWPTWSSI